MLDQGQVRRFLHFLGLLVILMLHAKPNEYIKDLQAYAFLIYFPTLT